MIVKSVILPELTNRCWLYFVRRTVYLVNLTVQHFLQYAISKFGYSALGISKLCA
ncbi:MAG: hypothetical protein RIT27_518 [Pseudomonadota bacterium]|jgi:hypothetical protein